MKISVIIPCYKVTEHVLDVIKQIPDFVSIIYCVDDCCPDKSGDLIEDTFGGSRVVVIRHEKNKGVGGATKSGYKQALKDGADIIVKIDGDGQMNPALISTFTEPIVNGDCDYTKGNRFYNPGSLSKMPVIRIIGNSVLSFISKFSTGYWNIFDPTNGYTAIHRKVLELLPLDKISDDYFYESDILFRLNTVRAVIVDIPMDALYENEKSHLNIVNILAVFSLKHILNSFKRIFYNYFLRDFNVASVEILLGPILLIFGVIFGVTQWVESVRLGIEASSGTVMLAALPTIVGLQLILSALNYDINNQPIIPLQSLLNKTAD